MTLPVELERAIVCVVPPVLCLVQAHRQFVSPRLCLTMQY